MNNFWRAVIIAILFWTTIAASFGFIVLSTQYFVWIWPLIFSLIVFGVTVAISYYGLIQNQLEAEIQARTAARLRWQPVPETAAGKGLDPPGAVKTP